MGSTSWVALWLVADVHATRLRPVQLLAERVVVRCGLRSEATVPYPDLLAVGTVETRNKATMRATVAGRIDVAIRCKPQLARRLFGRKQLFDQLLVTVDRADEFNAALRARMVAAAAGADRAR